MTIKVIDLLNKIANGEEVPKRIKIDNILYYWDMDDRCYIDEDTDNWVDNIDYKWLEARISIDSKKDLNKKVEIIEEEPEIDIQGIEETEIKNDGRMDYFKYCNDGATESGYGVNYSKSDIATRKIINELIKAVKQLDKKIKEK